MLEGVKFRYFSSIPFPSKPSKIFFIILMLEGAGFRYFSLIPSKHLMPSGVNLVQ